MSVFRMNCIGYHSNRSWQQTSPFLQQKGGEKCRECINELIAPGCLSQEGLEKPTGAFSIPTKALFVLQKFTPIIMLLQKKKGEKEGFLLLYNLL